MAYLTFAGSEERQSSAFKFIGADNKTQSTGLISDNTSLISNNVSSSFNIRCSFFSREKLLLNSFKVTGNKGNIEEGTVFLRP